MLSYIILALVTSLIVPKTIDCLESDPAPVPINDIPPGVSYSITKVSDSLSGV